MRILTLGWDFPPAVSGGIGTACRGLTRALARSGAQITFVLPRCPPNVLESVEFIGLDQESARQSVVDTVTDSSQNTQNVDGARRFQHPLFNPAESNRENDGGSTASTAEGAEQSGERAVESSPEHLSSVRSAYKIPGMPEVEFLEIAASLWPYQRPFPGHGGPSGFAHSTGAEQSFKSAPGGPAFFGTPYHVPHGAPQDDHRDDPIGYLPPPPGPPFEAMLDEIHRFAELAADAVTGRPFDVIHAHDWITFPAAERIASLTGQPFVAHVHSTEFDRSGQHIDQRIYDIEQAGLARADHVIAVSQLTRRLLMHRYGVPADKISVVYNAVEGERDTTIGAELPEAIDAREKIVLFLGRITVQKGPEYFLAAARKVLTVYPDVRFVMAGSGDAVSRTMKLAEEMGLADRVVFTGFLQGDDVERVFRSADLYVMPSVSDPFGIASLEAISFNVPVIMSRQSGAAEVFRHVLKVDFWDIDEMANKIVAVLRHPPLRNMLKVEAGYELRQLSWEDAAARCQSVFEAVMDTARKRRQANAKPRLRSKHPTPSAAKSTPRSRSASKSKSRNAGRKKARRSTDRINRGRGSI